MIRTLELVSRNYVEYRHRCLNQSISGKLARDIVFDLHVLSIGRLECRKFVKRWKSRSSERVINGTF